MIWLQAWALEPGSLGLNAELTSHETLGKLLILLCLDSLLCKMGILRLSSHRIVLISNILLVGSMHYRNMLSVRYYSLLASIFAFILYHLNFYNLKLHIIYVGP